MPCDPRFAAFGSIGALVGVAALKTMATKLIFLNVMFEPVAYSLLSALVTALLVVITLLATDGTVPTLRMATLLRLLPVCCAIAVDLALSNVAISMLPLPLQQAIASTIPAATILLETLVTRTCKTCATYVIISVLCVGAVLAHLSSSSLYWDGPSLTSNEGYAVAASAASASAADVPAAAASTAQTAAARTAANMSTAAAAMDRQRSQTFDRTHQPWALCVPHRWYAHHPWHAMC